MYKLILKSLLIPSFFCFIIILIGVLKKFVFKKKNGLTLILIGLSLYYFFSITPGSDLLIGPLESDFKSLAAKKADKANIIVVLSGGKKSDIIRSSEVLRIFNLHNNNEELKLIISGTVELDPDNKTSKVENYFISRGIPPENIIVEDNSQNTRENSKEVIKEIGAQPFFLVTSAYHMKRALFEFKKLGGKPIPAPIDFRKKGVYGVRDFIPSSDNLKKSDLAVYEYLGNIYYRLFD